MKLKWIIFLIFLLNIFFHAEEIIGQGGEFIVIPFSDSVNSEYDEQAPVMTPDGGKIYFTRAKHPENIGGRKDPGDIWFSEMDEQGRWSTPRNPGEPLNNSQYNAITGIDGKSFYLTGHYIPGDKKPKTRGLSVSYESQGQWSFPEPLDIQYYSNLSDHQSACLSYDGNIMVHSMESYNGRGAEDLYVSFKKPDGSWTDVKNLGTIINTRYQEKTPFLAADNQTLIFSSNGHGGEGSMDLFMSRREDDTWNNWSAPVNLGRVINTNGRELYYFVLPGSDEAIFCSTLNSDGYGDIKHYQLKPEDIIEALEVTMMAEDTSIQEFITEKDVLVLKGKVFNAETNEPIEAGISVLLSNESTVAEISTDIQTGEYQIEFASKNNFIIRIGARGFMNVEDNIQLSDSDQPLILKNYYLEPLEVGKTFKLNNVLFNRATATLVDTAYAELDNVFRMMSDNPEIHIELSGHTDNQGNARKNLELSQARVDVVKDYLVSHGIQEERISGKGYGGTRPITSNRTEETRRLNRRVEFKVIQTGSQ
ncbi:MAG: OmpA family protein [Cyclobacteriaceae bacterium]|nr:OmpA family protein [Cyclobacteriaceae bacterium]